MRPTRSSAPSMRSRPRTEAWASTSRKIIPRLASSVWSSRKSWRPLDRPSAKLRDRKIFYSIGELGVSSRVRPLKKYRAEKALPNLEGLADHETKTTIRRPSMRITFRQSGFGRDVGTAPRREDHLVAAFKRSAVPRSASRQSTGTGGSKTLSIWNETILLALENKSVTNLNR